MYYFMPPLLCHFAKEALRKHKHKHCDNDTSGQLKPHGHMSFTLDKMLNFFVLELTTFSVSSVSVYKTSFLLFLLNL